MHLTVVDACLVSDHRAHRQEDRQFPDVAAEATPEGIPGTSVAEAKMEVDPVQQHEMQDDHTSQDTAKAFELRSSGVRRLF
jgi:hypothetical protein